MKKTVILFLLLALPLTSFAQLVSSSSLVVTKQKLPPVQPRFQQTVETGFYMSLDEIYVPINYIAGYRFNNTFFFGGGAGLLFDCLGGNIDHHFNRTVWDDVRHDYVYRCDPSYNELATNLLSVPVFAHFRAYFTKTRVSPYFGLSAGGVFSTQKTVTFGSAEMKYSTIRAMIQPQLGLNTRMRAKSDFYFSFIVNMMTQPICKGHDAITMTLGNTMEFTFGLNIGFSF